MGRTQSEIDSSKRLNTPFLGQLGANQASVISREDGDPKLLAEQPDVAPGMTWRESLDLCGLRSTNLWKAGFIEGLGTLLFVFIANWSSLSPPDPPTRPDAQYGVFDNAAYIGPLTSVVQNTIFLALLIFSLGTVSGAHLNPTITIATFLTRLCSLPRAVIYLSFQLLGATLAGYLIRAAWGSREFKVGGCWIFTEFVSVREAFVIEFVTCSLLIFLVFGVGLDPRQRDSIPKPLGPFLIGLSLGILTWTASYTKYGYGGACLNPVKCFSAFVGSRFPGWHWYHWVADICACMLHALAYTLVPPGHFMSDK